MMTKIDKNIFDKIMFTYSMFRKLVFHRLKGSGLTTGQPKILEFLAQSGPVIQKEIASACEIETSTVGRLLRKLESGGLIRREQLLENRRVVRVSLTDLGVRKASLVQESFRLCEEDAFFGIGREQRCHFLGVLCQMEENLRAAALEQEEKRKHGYQQERATSLLDADPLSSSPLKQVLFSQSGRQTLSERKPRIRSLHQELQSCQAVLYQQLFRFLKGTGLTPGQPKILEFLEIGEGSQQKEIAAACRIKPATVTSLLFYMEQAELIERREENGDRRSQHVYLTPKGRQNTQKTIRALERTMEAAFKGIEQEQEDFKKILRLLRENLRQAAEREGL
ncbi:MAG: MarR family transcriptional regulator [Firmicutes bacterium]|nr:MarR family transcriptional regulator [Bacillota bacterium]